MKPGNVNILVTLLSYVNVHTVLDYLSIYLSSASVPASASKCLHLVKDPPFHNPSSKSIHNFLGNPAYKQTEQNLVDGGRNERKGVAIHVFTKHVDIIIFEMLCAVLNVFCGSNPLFIVVSGSDPPRGKWRSRQEKRG